MAKISISIRLDNALVKWVDSQKTSTMNRSDVIAQLLLQQKSVGNKDAKDAAKSDLHSDTDLPLLQMGARSAIMSMRILEQFIKSTVPSESKSIQEKALAVFKENIEEVI